MTTVTSPPAPTEQLRLPAPRAGEPAHTGPPALPAPGTMMLGYVQVRMTAAGSPGAADRRILHRVAAHHGWRLSRVFVDAALGPRVGRHALAGAARSLRAAGVEGLWVLVPGLHHLDRDPEIAAEQRLGLAVSTGAHVLLADELPLA